MKISSFKYDVVPVTLWAFALSEWLGRHRLNSKESFALLLIRYSTFVRSDLILLLGTHMWLVCHVEYCVLRSCFALRGAVTHCNALQRTATYCNTIPHTLQHCCTLRRVQHSTFLNSDFIFSFKHVSILYTCDMNHSYVLYYSFMCVTWLLHVWRSIFLRSDLILIERERETHTPQDTHRRSIGSRACLSGPSNTISISILFNNLTHSLSSPPPLPPPSPVFAFFPAAAAVFLRLRLPPPDAPPPPRCDDCVHVVQLHINGYELMMDEI